MSVAAVRSAGADGGALPGGLIRIGSGGFKIAAIAAGACIVAVDAVLSGTVDNATRSYDRRHLDPAARLPARRRSRGGR